MKKENRYSSSIFFIKITQKNKKMKSIIFYLSFLNKIFSTQKQLKIINYRIARLNNEVKTNNNQTFNQLLIVAFCSMQTGKINQQKLFFDLGPSSKDNFSSGFTSVQASFFNTLTHFTF